MADVDQGRAAPKPSLDPLARLLRSDLERVNRLIVERMHSPVSLIPQLASHIVAGGGKRLRPMLTLGCARMCGYRGDRHIALAAAVEFIHTATLLHDDVVDASDLRRGRDTANAVWGNKPAVLVGDFLFSRAFELMVADGSLRVLEILSRAVGGHRRGRGHAADDDRRHENDRSRLSRRDRVEDRRVVRRREPHRRGSGRAPRQRRTGARPVRPQSRHRVSAGRRHARLFGARGRARQKRSATIFATAR